MNDYEKLESGAQAEALHPAPGYSPAMPAPCAIGLPQPPCGPPERPPQADDLDHADDACAPTIAPAASSPPTPTRDPTFGDAPPRPPDPSDAPDPLLASLGRHFRGVVVRLNFELYTPVVQQAFRRDFAYLSRQLHALESSRRVEDIDHELLDEALAAIADRSRLGCETLSNWASETRTLIALSGYADAALDFGRALRVPATIVSPHARAFLDMLVRADELQSQTEMAWLLGLLDPESRARRTWACRNELIEFKEFVRRQRHVVGEHVRQVNTARRVLVKDVARQRPARRAS